MKMLWGAGGGGRGGGVVEGLWKIGEVKGVGVNSGYRSKGLITWAGLARFSEISVP